jgi:hypothetical protein
VEDLIAPNDFLDYAVWKFTFRVEGQSFDWNYAFNPPHWKGVKAQTKKETGVRLLLTPQVDQDGAKRRSRDDDALFLGQNDLNGIGPIEGRIYAYYRRSEVLNATGSTSQMKSWLDDQTGVRVYRDGVRVFTYGERNDDWLGLNVRRINTPAGSSARTPSSRRSIWSWMRARVFARKPTAKASTKMMRSIASDASS